MTVAIADKGYRIEKVAPDGGWGYIVSIGLALSFTCALGSFGSFGLIYSDFITSCGGATSSVTIIMSVCFCSLSFAGLAVSPISKKYSMRACGIIGGIMYFLGNILTIFATSVAHLVVSFGVFQGIGMGIFVTVAYSTFNEYFVKRRVIMMSVTQTLVGLGTMAYPIFAQFLMDTYGYRGTVAMIAACSAHAILGMLVMHPVEWHQKTIRVPFDEEKPFMNTNEKDIKPEYIELKVLHELKATDSGKNNRSSVPNLNELQSMRNERSQSLDAIAHLGEFDSLKSRISSRILSLGELSADVVINAEKESRNEKWYEHQAAGILSASLLSAYIWKSEQKLKFVDYLDLTLLKDAVYVNIVLGTSFALYSDNTFFTLEPMYLFELGFSKADAAKIISIGAASDLISRTVLAIASLFVHVKARYVYLAGATATVFARFVFLNVFDFVGLAVLTSIMGFFRTWVHTPLALVYGEHLPRERFASGYGLFMFLSGNIGFLLGPFIGWIRDATNYVICFHMLTFLMALCAVPWIIEIVYCKIYQRKNVENN